jgi:hypothetical protein
MKKATPAQLAARKKFTAMVRAKAAAKKRNKSYLGAFPVGFKGSLYGWPFTIRAQYRIDGITAGQIWDDNGLVLEITGKDKKEINHAIEIIKSQIVSNRPDIMAPTKYAKKEKKDIFKRVELLVKDLYKETAELNKGIRSTGTKTAATKTAAIRTAATRTAAKKPAATRTKRTTAKKPAATRTTRTTAKTYIKNKQTGQSERYYDEMKKALPPGKRQSDTGRTYYEYRRNRTDAPGKLTGHGGIDILTIGEELSALEYRINDVKARKRTAKLQKDKKELTAELTILNKQFKTLKDYLNSRAKFI